MSGKVTNQKTNQWPGWMYWSLQERSKLWICENGSGSMTGELWKMPVDDTNSDEVK